MNFKFLLVFMPVLFLASCGHDGSNGTVLCQSPLAVQGTPSDLGYIVGLKEGNDPSSVASEYIERYGNEINVYTISTTFFAAEIGEDVLNVIRCDERVTYIQYDELATFH